MRQCSECKCYKSLSDYYSKEKFSNKRGKYLYYHPECKECTKIRSRKWIKDHPESFKKNLFKYNQKPERKKKLYGHHKKRIENGKYREYIRNNPDKVKIYKDNHKNHDITTEEWIGCKNYFSDENGEWSCAYCGFLHKKHTKRMLNKIVKQDLHKEHVIHNGADDLSNCIPSCQRCNSSKHTKDLLEWYPVQSYYSESRLKKINQWTNMDYKTI